MGAYNSSSFSEEDLRILEGMEDLRGISVYTDGFPALQFIKTLEYVNIAYSEEGYLSDQNNLGEMSVLGKEIILDRLAGNIKRYLRITEAGQIYELFYTDFVISDNEFDEFYETKLFISQQDGDDYRLIESLDVPGRIGNASGGLIFADVDYDNNKDILIKRGHFGNQGLVTYTCFLWRDKGYVQNESFSLIANPSLDLKNKKILSTWRNWAASHSWAMYSFADGLFIETDRLTEEPESNNIDEWQFIVEKFIDGKVTESQVYLTKDYTEEEISAFFYNEEGFWGLDGDKWNTLNNYNSTSIDVQVDEIINS